MICARQFPALISIADKAIGEPIPDKIKPRGFCKRRLNKLSRRLAEVKRWSKTRAEMEANKAFKKEFLCVKRDSDKFQAISDNYIALLSRVASWVPPTQNHQSLKNFMLDQLLTDMNFLMVLQVPEMLSGEKYRSKLISRITRDIKIFTLANEKDIENAEWATVWLEKLRKSLETSF